MTKINTISTLIISLILLSCSKKKEVDKRIVNESLHEDGSFDLHAFSHAEEPYLTMTRTVQLLNSLQIRGWSIAHIRDGEYNIYVKSNGKSTFLDGRDIKLKNAEFLYLQYAQKDNGNLTIHSLTNGSSTSVGLPSPFTSAARFRKAPIPAKNGKYILCQTYDKTGSIVLSLSGVSEITASNTKK